MDYQYIGCTTEGSVGIITLQRPEVFNALNLRMVDELVEELERLDRDSSIRVVLLTGNDKAFAAGADIDEMANETVIPMVLKDQFAVWDRISKIKKPIMAAVSGFVLGGGCELLMNCDMVVASESVKIGQPEIKLGVMPGAGGVVRLTKAVGKAKAMEMLLTGEPISADEALQYGLVNQVVPVESYYRVALDLAKRISEMPAVAVRMIKQTVLHAIDNPVQAAMDYERNCFYLLFATQDRTEGMQAFVEKRKAEFVGM